MFWNKNKIVINLKNEIDSLKSEKESICNEAITSKRIVCSLREEIEDLKLKKKMEMKEVEHLVKMAKEKNEIEFEKNVAVIQKEYNDKLTEAQKKYYEEHMKTIKEVYKQIMERLPNVNMEIRRGRK